MDETERTVYLAELQCFLCGNLAGAIEVDRKPMPPFGIWHSANGSPPQRLADWRSLRCGRCGGALYVESIEALVRHEDEAQRPPARRGRPPKWLVEQRRKAHEAAEGPV
jgi:hypothetical protein